MTVLHRIAGLALLLVFLPALQAKKRSGQQALIPGKLQGKEVAFVSAEQRAQVERAYAILFGILDQLEEQVEQCRVDDPERAEKFQIIGQFLERMIADRIHPVKILQTFIELVDKHFPQEQEAATTASDES